MDCSDQSKVLIPSQEPITDPVKKHVELEEEEERVESLRGKYDFMAAVCGVMGSVFGVLATILGWQNLGVVQLLSSGVIHAVAFYFNATLVFQLYKDQ